MQVDPGSKLIVRCPDCRAKYEVTIEREMEPSQKVRCPRCKAVFPVTGRETLRSDSPGEGGVVPPVRRSRITDPGLARRLARAMISEFLLNHREELETAAEEGRLLARFGPALVQAHDLYQERVSPDLPGASRTFREAVNDLLGQGTPIL
jgi:predicted Zn finger-like uncharacterized protein